jgi:hypothetical protein
MPGEVMADTAVGMLSNMPEPAMLRAANTLVSVLAVDVVSILRGPREDTRAMRVAYIIGMAAVTGEAVTGIRPMDILDRAITATAIRPTELAITVTATVVTMVRTTDTILTATATGRP